MPRIYLVEIDAWDPAEEECVTLRFSSGLGYNHPSADGFYEPRLLEPGQLRRAMFAHGATLGPVQAGYGEIRLVNTDGGLDALRTWGFGGRALRVLVGDSDAAYEDFLLVFRGLVQSLSLTDRWLDLQVRDRLADLDRPLLTATYGGTNEDGDGLDGEPEMEGTIIPRVYGTVLAVPGRWVNRGKDIYQVSDRPCRAYRVLDHMIDLPDEEDDYADATEIEDAGEAPTPGHFRAWPEGGMFRLGAPAVGQVTAFCRAGDSDADRTTAQILKQIALDMGIDAGDIDAGDVTTLDSQGPAVTGLWVQDSATALQCMATVATSAGAWFGFDRLGKLRMAQLRSPAGTPVANLRSLKIGEVAVWNTIDLVDFAIATGGTEGQPYVRVFLDWAHCWAPQPAAVGEEIENETRAFFSREYRRAMREDLSVLTVHPYAPELVVTTQITNPTDAATEINRVMGLRKVERLIARATIAATDTAIETIDLGAVVQVFLPRFGLAGGRLFRVSGITYRLAANLIDLDLWG